MDEKPKEERKSKPVKPPAKNAIWLNLQQAAAIYGIHERTLRELCDNKTIEASRPPAAWNRGARHGRRWMIKRTAMDAHMERGMQK